MTDLSEHRSRYAHSDSRCGVRSWTCEAKGDPTHLDIRRVGKTPPLTTLNLHPQLFLAPTGILLALLEKRRHSHRSEGNTALPYPRWILPPDPQGGEQSGVASYATSKLETAGEEHVVRCPWSTVVKLSSGVSGDEMIGGDPQLVEGGCAVIYPQRRCR
jgi:hypothetical protein